MQSRRLQSVWHAWCSCPPAHSSLPYRRHVSSVYGHLRASTSAQDLPSTQAAASGDLPRKLLVANRGAIAARIFKTAKRLGIQTVAVYSDEDAKAVHTLLADEAVRVGPSSSLDSYLRIDRIIEACKLTGADAVHPGYGFLSENASFADALAQAGITFVGPPAQAIRDLGDKIGSKRLAQRADVNLIPGHVGEITNDEQALAAAEQVGYPIMVKASAGGGGKGMRVAHTPQQLLQAVRQSGQEAVASFGDGRLLLERYFPRSRHIEIQVLGDQHGHLLWLPERECSIQRRHQKVIEESPSPAVSPAIRRAMGEQAVRLARAAGYFSAGTVEFLVDDDLDFYFLEMNTRLQVEHSVTEDVTGLDLVEQMLRVAAGHRLQFTQDEASRVHGHSIQCRICAEDPAAQFMPSAGRITAYHQPAGPGVRVLSGIEPGARVPSVYDSLVSKIVAHAPDRAGAIARLGDAMDRYVIRGVRHNAAFLRHILDNVTFRRGDLSTAFIPEQFGEQGSMNPLNFALCEADEQQVRVLAVLRHVEGLLSVRLPGSPTPHAAWNLVVGTADGSNVPVQAVLVDGVDGGACRGRTLPQQDLGCTMQLVLPGATLTATLQPVRSDPGALPTPLLRHAVVDGVPVCFQVHDVGPREVEVQFKGARRVLSIDPPQAAALRHHMRSAEELTPDSGLLVSPMCGLLAEVHVTVGQSVRAGDPLASLQAMKMVNVLVAEVDGTVEAVYAKAGSTVSTDDELLKVVPNVA